MKGTGEERGGEGDAADGKGEGLKNREGERGRERERGEKVEKDNFQNSPQ